ncbi:recombinase family protein [Rhizobium leguminosarum]|uniref:recombinase family protein n=1 Tax=Rhizobium leguminosarum TaxID=384 RepID=UPI001C9212B6|nr:recombinase family protein [Rhizobium leguminosarum]MBY2966229.1 recombinase family protein [Rhizobium leguminosarum]
MTHAPARKAYSYIRFSTPDQIKGDSARRQISMAESYAAKHGLALDDSLSLKDFGVSAFRGQNAKTGALNFFLEHVRSGDVPEGSILLIEALDRLSRQTPLDALDTLRDIMGEGVTVITLDNETVYTTETLSGNFTQLIVTLMLFSRANEESATKARRLKEAWEGKRLKAATTPLTAICPAWLELNDQRTAYEVIPDRADTIRRIFTMCLDGLGQHTIAARLITEGTPTFGRSEMWHRSYVKKLLENPAVIGRFTPHTLTIVDGRKVRTPRDPVEEYFPAIVDVEVFEKVAAMNSFRGMSTASGNAATTTANVLAGLAKCPTCGATMTRVNKGGRKGGKPYLVCTKAKAGAGCRYKQVKLEAIEEAVVSLGTYLHDLTPSPNADSEASYRDMRRMAEVVEEQIQNLVEAVAQGDRSKAIQKAISANEAELDRIHRELEALAHRVADTITNRIENTVAEFSTLTEGGNIAKINATMRQLFDRVVVDYDTGYLRLYWRHTEHTPVDVLYTFPTEKIAGD